MKTRILRWCMAVLFFIALTFSAVSCEKQNPDDPETNPNTADETEPSATGAGETDAETPTETETETEEETTRRELTWESYDPALDNSAVDTTKTPEVKPTTWVAVDGLGRVLPTNTDTGDVRQDKIVACFYWTWHGDFANGQTAYNNQQNLDKLYEAGYTKADYWSLPVSRLRELGIYVNNNSYHFWDEPIYGYYDGDDEWVIRKQAELLAAAGVDVVFFDNTNGSFTWLDTALRVMKVFSEARAQGVDAPCVSFMLPFGATDGAREQLLSLYANIYEKGLYQDVWFYLDGKPMLMGYSSCLSSSNERQAEIKEFFTWRANVAGYLDTETAANQWGWLSVYPQAYFHNAAGEIEQMTVGVAVNHDYVNHVIAPMSGENIIGRTWTNRGYDARENALYYGACFAQQWETALAVDPQIVFVTAWNEWVALRLPYWTGNYYNCYVDQFNAEFSRDCEPSRGVLKDYYYYQLASYIRKFKGTEAIEPASEEKLIDVNGGYGQFANVTPTYTDYFGLPDRDADGYRDPVTGKRLHYTNTSGRNDIYDCKVARDYDNLYFMVRTVDNLTPYTDADWMHLYISVGESEENWEYYEYVINKTTPTADKAYVEKFTGNGYESTVVGQVSYKVTGNVLVIEVPKTMLGISADTLDFTIDFKWTDNTGADAEGDILQWYTDGDTAPVGRFNYRYTTTAPEAYVPVEDTFGWLLMDFTDESVKAEFDEYVVADSGDVTAALGEEGLVLTAANSDAKFIINYSNSTVGISTDVYKYIAITYKTTSTSEMKVAAAGGNMPKAIKTRSQTVTLTEDGEWHTAVLDMTGSRESRYWAGGYATQMGFFLDGAAAGDSVTIRSIQFFKEAPDTE